MKVLIDTSVLLSAAWKDGKPETVVLFVVGQAEFESIVSADILQEYRDVLSRPKSIFRRLFKSAGSIC